MIAPRLYLVALIVALVSIAYPAAAQSASKADDQAGAALFRDKGCTFCHGADLKGTTRGPSLENIQDDKDWPADKMTNQILNGGKKMPPFANSLSDEEIAQLVAYLRAKDRPAPPPDGTSGSPTPQ